MKSDERDDTESWDNSEKTLDSRSNGKVKNITGIREKMHIDNLHENGAAQGISIIMQQAEMNGKEVI